MTARHAHKTRLAIITAGGCCSILSDYRNRAGQRYYVSCSDTRASGGNRNLENDFMKINPASHSGSDNLAKYTRDLK